MHASDAAGAQSPADPLTIHVVRQADGYPAWASREQLAQFLHENMKPYEDEVPDIQRALDYVHSSAEGKGGFIVLAADQGELVGAVVMLRTGMSGYIPEWILVFISVHPDRRNAGIGGHLMQEALSRCDGDVKLHVEYENPAKRLYERVGFTSKYAEMRYSAGGSQ